MAGFSSSIAKPEAELLYGATNKMVTTAIVVTLRADEPDFPGSILSECRS
jgi:hypothetical protein